MLCGDLCRCAQFFTPLYVEWKEISLRQILLHQTLSTIRSRPTSSDSGSEVYPYPKRQAGLWIC
jgi:hypothetical protein